MGSLYLLPKDFPLYGVDPATSVSDVAAASSLVDSYLDRPEGLIFVSDIDGNPCYMQAKSPTRTFKLQAPIVAGSSVKIALPANLVLNSPMGEAVVLDRDTALMELCRIIAADATSVTLAKAVRPHSANCAVDFGMTNDEVRNVPAKRSISRVARFPLVRLASACGKYEYGRRSDQVGGVFQDMNLLATVQTFGGPPPWTPIDPANCDFGMQNCEIWIPAGLLIAYYSQVKFWYLSGFSDAPTIVKSACAAIIHGANSNPDLSGNIKSLKAGDTQITRFRDTVLDADTKKKLDQYKIRAMY
jgi:hypothetical protein